VKCDALHVKDRVSLQEHFKSTARVSVCCVRVKCDTLCAHRVSHEEHFKSTARVSVCCVRAKTRESVCVMPEK